MDGASPPRAVWTSAKLTLAFLAWASQPGKPAAVIEDLSHSSQVMGEVRRYRVFLPPDYAASNKRYPVIYFFHGWSERYNQPAYRTTGRNYDQGADFGGDN